MMRIHSLIGLAVLGATFVASPRAAEIWVSPSGDNAASGTREQPLARLDAALRRARELRRLKDPSVTGGVRIVLRGGDYRLVEPVFVRPEDSGTADSPTLIEAAVGERPVLSGGVAIEGWRRVTGDAPGLPAAAKGHVWVAEAPSFNGRPLEFRQLWVNDRKAVRAREPNGEQMVRLAAWDRAREEAWVPAASVARLGRLQGVEMLLHQQWEIAVLRLKAVRVDGERACVTFHQPESRIQFEHPWPQPILDKKNPERTSAFILVNALEFLDGPGEWYQEPQGGRVYYWPRSGEDLSRDVVVAPALENIVQVAGSIDRPVAHLQFKGIALAHTTWLRPSLLGHVPHQAAMPMLDAYQLKPKGTPDWRGLDNQAWIGRAPAAVTLTGAHHVQFERCRFEHLAMSGVDLIAATHDNVIEGCVFRDVGANGIQLGYYGEAGWEIHLPYEPTEERVVCRHERIANNLLDDIANEDWGGVALSVGWARAVTLEHNEIVSTSYTGISVGWGWTRTAAVARSHAVRANRIHRFASRMSDTAGIYLLSNQAGSMVTENAIEAPSMSPWVHDPEHWGYVYLDEGSSFTVVRDNWSPVEKLFKNSNGPGNTWDRNGPMVADDIKAAAGLEPAFRDLLPATRDTAK